MSDTSPGHRNYDEEIGDLKARMKHLEECIKGMDSKLDSILAYTNMGKGALWLLMKMGGYSVLLMGAATAFYDHIWKGLSK